ncbi:MAG: hypothetical protein PHG16_00800 [Lachnospiraceae bacterium]|nr:hypothetical protein [Lachnospiraceae bacterium]
MKKKIIVTVSAMVIAFSLAACGSQSGENSKSAQSADSVSESTQTAGTVSESAKSESTVSKSETTEASSAAIEDGVYNADFNTDSGMFHANEANNGKGTLTVKDGKMTFHVSLASKNIVNLYLGTAEDAQKEGADLLMPTTDTVTYSDGTSEEVYGFDIPISAIGEDFDLALVGTKGTWYDHKVSIANPEKAQ